MQLIPTLLRTGLLLGFLSLGCAHSVPAVGQSDNKDLSLPERLRAAWEEDTRIPKEPMFSGSLPVADGLLLVGRLRPDETLKVIERAQGCFHGSTAEYTFQSGKIVDSELGEISLSNDHIEELDNYFRLASGRFGGCTTVKLYDLELFRHDELVDTATYIDGSCAETLTHPFLLKLKSPATIRFQISKALHATE